MLDIYGRAFIQRPLDKLSTYIPSIITPGHITILALVLGLLSGVCITQHFMLYALTLMWLSGIADMLDGTVARQQNRSTLVGAYIDLIADRMVESAIIVGFACAYPQHSMAYILFLVGVLLHFSTFLATAAIVKNTGIKGVHFDRALVERAEAFVAFSLMLLFPAYIFETLMLFNVLVFSSALARFLRILRAQNYQEENSVQTSSNAHIAASDPSK